MHASSLGQARASGMSPRIRSLTKLGCFEKKPLHHLSVLDSNGVNIGNTINGYWIEVNYSACHQRNPFLCFSDLSHSFAYENLLLKFIHRKGNSSNFRSMSF